MEEKDQFKIGDKEKNIEGEGEFIPSYFAWVSLDKQKKIVEKLQKITKKKDK